jgi:5-methylcytosine-specific restriction protein A
MSPQRSARPCAGHGCSNLVSARGSYCISCAPRHARSVQAIYEHTRPQAHERGYDSKWKRARKAFIRAHPVCRDPYQRHVGTVEPTAQVDHIVPHKGDRALFWNRRNWQPLCTSCGAYKSAIETGGRSESSTPSLAPLQQLGTSGRITHMISVGRGDEMASEISSNHRALILSDIPLQPTRSR